MPLTLLFIHHREVRRLKSIEAESVEEGEKRYEAFVESAAADDDSSWDEIEDDDSGESELREICGKGRLPADDLFDAALQELSDPPEERPRGLTCQTCGERIPDDDLRTHLAGHHPGAWAFDTAQVRNCYGEWP
jgi:hypothetical protein